MSLLVRLLFLTLIVAAVCSVVGYILYDTLFSTKSTDEKIKICGLRGPYYIENESNLTANNSLLIKKTRYAIKDEYPFHLSIILIQNTSENDVNELNKEKEKIFCDGILINDDSWLLTSAHCINKTNILLNESFVVTSFVSKNNYLNENITKVNIEKLIFHPNFTFNETSKLFTNDIALVKINSLTNNTNNTDFTCPICLPKLNDTSYFTYENNSNNNNNNISFLTTWLTDETLDEVTVEKEKEKKLVTSEMKIVNESICIKNLDQSFNNLTMICTSNGENVIKVTTSGSPLVMNINSKYVLVAVSSFDIKDSDTGSTLIIYTKIYNYIQWISETINNLKP